MKILILPGDGIGPEIMAATMTALKALNDKHALKLDFEEHAVGLAALEAGGSTLSDDLLERIRAAEGTILGPCDTYAYPPVEEGGVNPSATRTLWKAAARPDRHVRWVCHRPCS